MDPGNAESFIQSSEERWLGRLRNAIACLCISLSGTREKLIKYYQEQREAAIRYKQLVERLRADAERMKVQEE
jgi:hypothetical protein